MQTQSVVTEQTVDAAAKAGVRSEWLVGADGGRCPEMTGGISGYVLAPPPRKAPMPIQQIDIWTPGRAVVAIWQAFRMLGQSPRRTLRALVGARGSR